MRLWLTVALAVFVGYAFAKASSPAPSWFVTQTEKRVTVEVVDTGATCLFIASRGDYAWSASFPTAVAIAAVPKYVIGKCQ